jgi:actin-related protein
MQTNEQYRLYYQQNKEKIKNQKKANRQDKLEQYKQKARDRYELKKDEIVACQKERRKKFPEKALLVLAKQRAKKKGLDFNITEEDIVIPEYCPLLHYRLERGEGSVQNSSPTLDRFDPTKGYIKGNVWVISNRANRIKQDASVSELVLLVSNLEQYACK